MAPLLVLSADERHAVLGALADLLRMKHGDAVLPVAFFEGIFWGDGGDLGEHVAEATILDVLVRKARAQMDAKRILQGVKAYRDRGEGNAEVFVIF
jgi:hypothetical protein